MVMEFRLLGDVDVRVDGRPVDVGHTRQRCVLAALLVDANQAVPVDQLVERVWAHRVPQRARGTVYTYVARLRRALSVVDDTVGPARRPGGYVLTIDPMAVDLHRFSALLVRARAADDETALALVEQALGLWRGQALAGLDTPWFDTVRAAANKHRQAAELDRNELALRLGRHHELLAELATAAEAYPLDERLAAQLMLALYRSGRQHEALNNYQRVRLRLADELGTDPGPSLRQLHQQILQADPALTVQSRTVGTPGRQAPPAAPVPRQLPVPVRHFTGRAGELATLTGLLDQAADAGGTVVISAIAGTAGIGKTALAVHWAHGVAARFPDGHLYTNLRGFDPSGQVTDPADVVRRFLAALNVPPQRIPTDPDAQAALYRSHIAGRRMLILLDNAHDSAQVRPLLPGAPGCLVLVTSRNQLTGLVADGAQPIRLDLFTDAEARDVLRRRVGQHRVSAEPEAVEEIIARCARLPLALSVAAAHAAAHPSLPLESLAAQLREAHGRLDVLTGDDPHSDVRAVFSWSYQALTPSTARLFRLLGLHPGPDVAAPAIASLAGLPLTEVRPLLAELGHANLITEHAPGRYTLHDLLRAYATEQTHAEDSNGQRLAATHRLLDHYLHTGYTADRLVHPARDPIPLSPAQPGVTPEHLTDHEAAMAWFAAEHRVLLAAVDHAAATGFDTHTWQLAGTLRTFLSRRGYWHDQASVGRAALAAAQRLGDPATQARAHRNLAGVYVRLDLPEDAHTQLGYALDLTARAGDRTGQAHTHYHLGMLGEQQGELTQAVYHTRQALDLFQTVGHRVGQANALNNIGWCHARLGDHRQSLEYCQKALALHQELDDPFGQAATWDSLGYVHHHLGDDPEAVVCYQHALTLYRDLGDRYNQADVLTHLGDTHHAADNPQAARDAWQHALTILDDLNHPDAENLRTRLRALDIPSTRA
jgi:DNA-binding SARP family transcriptional activator